MKILFICTHNRCRSILSEAITNQLTDSNVVARSAGSQPVGEVHPLSLKYLKLTGFDTSGLLSKSWDKLEDFAPDVVVTVCDSAAKESCPVWFGEAINVHWGLEDPSKMNDASQAEQAFLHTIDIISTRAKALNYIAQQPKTEWHHALKKLGANE
ncbi:arsenate reductase ArsC [Alteromonas sp. ASW11-130]|uniref:arsenate reductase ArsC n=1 Tax=Alteromonas sp. ASW11-130 TaxID=3015775 RepID=UPI002242031D|nr:arsenate reductase ArsC [Alteromonas sp. ASW11-130]MCW8091600.1 arsenate reductase ArsC [Alteromonas sp. ASW11-130]